MQLLARAKVNLSLHILGRREDGYHNLQSLVGFADFGDDIQLTPSDRTRVEFQGEFAKGLDSEKNSIVDSLHFLANYEPISTHYHVIVKKNIPVMAGLGGGTADSAAILRHLAPKLTENPENWPLFLPLGADVPVSVMQKTAVMEGIGEVIRPVRIDAPLYALFIRPNINLSTGLIFAHVQKFQTEFPHCDVYNAEDLLMMQNGLEEAAFSLAPELIELRQALSQSGAWLCRMTGSGSTVFGLYESLEKRDRAQTELRHRFPEFWIKPAQIAREIT